MTVMDGSQGMPMEKSLAENVAYTSISCNRCLVEQVLLHESSCIIIILHPHDRGVSSSLRTQNAPLNPQFSPQVAQASRVFEC